MMVAIHNRVMPMAHKNVALISVRVPVPMLNGTKKVIGISKMGPRAGHRSSRSVTMPRPITPRPTRGAWWSR